ncbi:SCO family protein [Leptothrix discophora]|uniref:SCO family protein n=1 Tax=Leptothrix discophora TaxID=89 RepID=A0ABT9G7P6_LEPDI|nr:SCO family protein [Leptothrix discophora]MDP4302506.1 SCO family protein [Leptothrix discophora]
MTTPARPVLRRPDRRRLLASAASAALPLWLAGCDAPPRPPFKSVDITGADYANRLELPDLDGRIRTLADFKGRLPVVFFGYTQCPDVCPTTLAMLAEARTLLGRDGDKLVGILVTIDPERDTPELLRPYVASFASDWIALRGDAAQTLATARTFKVFYRKAPGPEAGRYTMDHTAASYVFDPRGRIRLYVRNGTTAADLVADLRQLLAEQA